MVRGTFSPARAWRPAVVARLARTLGRTGKHPDTAAIRGDDGPVAHTAENQSLSEERMYKAHERASVPAAARYLFILVVLQKSVGSDA